MLEYRYYVDETGLPFQSFERRESVKGKPFFVLWHPIYDTEVFADLTYMKKLREIDEEEYIERVNRLTRDRCVPITPLTYLGLFFVCAITMFLASFLVY